MSADPIVIVAAKRTPMGNYNGVFKTIPTPQLGTYAIAALLDSVILPEKKVDAVYIGCVLSAGLGQAPARQAALGSNLPFSTPCTTINKMCGSGMQSILLGCRDIQSHHADIVIAGGMENMSRAPFLLQNARIGLRMGTHELMDHMQLDGLINAYPPHLSMGAIAENCALDYKITRAQQDAFAIASIQRATQATHAGFFKDEITPITVSDKKGNITTITEDEGIQKANIEKIAHLKPAFLENGSITAANASSISDGAAALMLMRLSKANKLNIKPIAQIIGDASIAQAPEQFPTAPIAAIKKLFEKIKWTTEDVDLFEINEAFAVVTLATMKTLGIPFEKVNVHGGACILGHPIGASGARILVTLIHALKQQKKKRGVAAICIGGGEAIAIAITLI